MRLILVAMSFACCICPMLGCDSQTKSADAAPNEVDSTHSKSPKSRISKIRLKGSALNKEAFYITVEDLEELEKHDQVLMDIYEGKRVQYSGMLLRDLVGHLAPNAKKVTISAVDDYRVTFTEEEWNQHDIFFATRKNGEQMSVAQKGPARIVIDFAPSQEKLSAILKPKWIWQISTMSFE